MRGGAAVPGLPRCAPGLPALRARLQLCRCRRRPGGVRDPDRWRHRGVRGADDRGGLSAAILAARGAVATAYSAGDACSLKTAQGRADLAAISSQGRRRPADPPGRRVNDVLAKPRRGGIFQATVLTLACGAILCGLGFWQLDRKVWKENLIGMLTTRLARPPQPLPPRDAWPRLVPDANEYTRVAFPAEFLEGQEALVYTPGSPLRPDVKGPGYWVMQPAQLAGGSIVLVNRGFVPVDKKDPTSRPGGATQGTVEVVGVMRWPEARGLFT